jgi:protein-disulfide isomerase
MPKHRILLLALIVFLLAACQPAKPLFAPTDTPSAAVQPTGISAAPTYSPAICKTNVSPFGQQDATAVAAASKVPPVTAEDWVKGDPNARVTILEYSDFQ